MINKTTLTLADVLERLESATGLTDQARRNIVSSVRALCRVIDRAPRFVVVSGPALRDLFREASPGVEDLSPSRWANVKSDVRRAVRLTGVLEVEATEVPLTSAWEELVARETDRNRRCAMRRFGRFCAARQCDPSEVTDDLVAAFHQHLDATGLSKTPERITRDLIRCWNGLRDREGLGLPHLSKRCTDIRYSFAWEELPAGLEEDARAFYQARLNPSPFDDLMDTAMSSGMGPGMGPGIGRPVRKTTADKQHRMLRQFASAAIHGGVARDDLKSLADLCRPEVARAALSFLMERNGSGMGNAVEARPALRSRIWRTSSTPWPGSGVICPPTTSRQLRAMPASFITARTA